MKCRLLLTTLALVFAAPAFGKAATRDSMIVTTAWLAEHLHDSSVVLLHVGDPKDYDSAHVPGARLVSLDMISVRGAASGLTLELPPLETLVERLESLGISDSSRIVICFGSDWVTPAARVYFTLDYAGLGDRTSLLDGGMRAWQREKRPVTAAVPAPSRGHLTVRPRPSAVADVDFMKAHLHDSQVVIVDSRLPQFYEGRAAGMMPRAGRIPGARSIPYESLLTSDNRLKQEAELRRLFASAGADERRTVVTYCHIGQQASLDYFVARYLGYPVRLYDGSFEQWSRLADLPVETGAGR